MNPSHGPEMAKDIEERGSAVAKKHVQKAMVGQNMNLTTAARRVSEEVVSEQGERSNHPITISYPFIHNLPKDIMPADLDWSINDKHAFIEEVVLNTLDKQVRHFTGSGNTPGEYPLKPVIEEIQKSDLARLYKVGRADRRLRRLGLLWYLPPWPGLNFCEVNWMTNGREKGAGTAAKKDSYNAVTGQSKIYSQQAKSKPFIEAGVKNEIVGAANGTPSTDLIASSNNTPQICFSPMKYGTGTIENQNNSPGVATPPPEFCCLISMKLMSEPVMIASGQTYEREKLSQSCHVHIKQGAFLYNLEVPTLPKSHHYFFIRLKLEYFKFSSLDSYEKSVSDFSYLVKRLVSVAMDRHDKEKEIVSVLLSSVYGAVVKVKMNGKLQDDTVFLKKWHDEEPFEFKTDEEEVIDGIDCAVLVSGSTKRVVCIRDPGTGSKNLKWQSSPLGVVGGLTFGATSAAGRAQPEDLFLTLKVESALYSAGAAESFCTARREDRAVAMCLMLAAKLLYAEGNLISHEVSEKAAEVFEAQMDSTTAWSNNRIQVRGFSVGQAQEAEPLFHGAFEGPVNGLASDSMRIYSDSWDMIVCIWGRAQMKLVQKFMHADWVWSLAPHGNTVACTAGRDAYLWDMGSSELTNIISNAYVGNAYSLARTHLPDVLFTRGEDGAIRLFSVYDVSDDEDINPAATWVHHTSPVHSLAFEYPWLVSASCDGRISLIELWKFLAPKSSSKYQFKVESCGPSAIDLPQRMLHGFGCSFFSIDIGADGIVCGDENGGVKVWNFSEALVYTITNEERRPYRLFCSIIGSIKDDILMLEEPDENVYLNIRHTKDFRFIMSNVFSDTHSKIVVEPPGPKSWKNVFFEEPGVILEEVDFCDTHLVLIWRQGRKLRFCSANLPLLENITVPAHLSDFLLFDLPLSNQVCQILSGSNYDSTMCFTISSLVMPDAVVDYNLLNGKWQIVQQQNMLHEGTKVLYGNASVANTDRLPSNRADLTSEGFEDCDWNELSEYYACEYYDVPSKDRVLIPLTLVYSLKHKQEGKSRLASWTWCLWIYKLFGTKLLDGCVITSSMKVLVVEHLLKFTPRPSNPDFHT